MYSPRAMDEEDGEDARRKRVREKREDGGKREGVRWGGTKM